MCAPRRVIPGAIQFVTRRISQGMYLLRPSAEVTAVVKYAYLLMARRFGIQIHCISVISNHVHIVLTDPHGNLPAFMEQANRLIARALNFHYDRRESFWAPGSYTAQQCTSAEAALDRMVYTITNPVKHGLVPTARQWPGWVSLPEELDGRPLVAKRPGFFFRENGPLPAEATGAFCPPAGFEHLSRQEFIAMLEQRVHEREQALQEEHEGRFLGAGAVKRVNPFDSPDNKKPLGNVRPTLASRLRAELVNAVRELRQWRREYREASRAYRAGDTSVEFPYGTYWMKHFSPARIAVGPPPLPPLAAWTGAPVLAGAT